MLLGTTTDHKLQSTLFDFLSDLDICDVSKELEKLPTFILQSYFVNIFAKL